MSKTTVRVLRPEEVAAATDVLARGFDEDPAKLALVPDAATRRIALELSARNRLYDAVRRRTAHAALVDGQPAAVAVWVPPGVREVSLAGGSQAIAGLVSSLSTLAPAIPSVTSTLRTDAGGLARLARARRRAVARAAEGHAWSLVLLATLPEHRGQGLARALLERQLRRCDEDEAPAWLETPDPVNVPIYERFGFRILCHLDGPAWLPGLWLMRRPPNP